MAFAAGMTAFRRTYYNSPDALINLTNYQPADDKYALLWSFYNNTVMNDYTWNAYRSQNRLYRYTRPIYNPTRRLVDFYAGTVYPGILTANAQRPEDGTIIAIPFAKDTPKKLTTAIATLWKWSNWHIAKGIMIRYAADMGECLVEVIDDVAKGKVEFQVQHPGKVRDLRLDFRGNVKGYTIEYRYDELDEIGVSMRSYRYKKVVDSTTIRYYRDDNPHDYGDGAVVSNPYGFTPAVWVKHIDVGDAHGMPCMRNIEKWEELFSLASHVMDQMHRVLEAPILVSGENIQALKTDVPDEAMATGVRQDAGRGNIPLLTGPLGSRLDVAQPPSGDAAANMDRLLIEVEKDHPELTMYHEMRRMSQVTGVAVGRLFGDVEIAVNEGRNNYDTQSIKLFQMGVAVAGMRAGNGDWGNDLTTDQENFLDFTLQSYARGELDMEIGYRPLVPVTAYEAIQTRRSEVSLEREQLMLEQMRANPLGDPNNPGLPSGDQASQISNRLRMRTSTEGAQGTAGKPPTA